MDTEKWPKLTVVPIYAAYGDSILLKLTYKNGEIKNYLIDGGPVLCFSKFNKSTSLHKSFQGLVSCLIELTRTRKGEFQLDGIVVTHPDHDHIEGVLKLLQMFSPNHQPLNDWAKFNFWGPLLITKLFLKEKAGNAADLIKILKNDYGFHAKFVEQAASKFVFGINSNFDFRFVEGYKGLVFRHTVQIQRPTVVLQHSHDIKVPLVTASIATRYTVDTSEANLSSIITVWGEQNDSGNINVVLTGDSVGYNVLKVVKGRTVNVFQVPHHGSARNSLPLQFEELPPRKDIEFVKSVLTFRFILGYQLDNSQWTVRNSDQIVRTAVNNIIINMFGNPPKSKLITFLNGFEKSIKVEDLLAILSPRFVNFLENTVKIDSEKFYFEEVLSTVLAIENNLKDYNSGEIEVQEIFSKNIIQHRNKLNWKSLCEKTIDNVESTDLPWFDLKKRTRSSEQLETRALGSFCRRYREYSINTFLDGINECRIAEFYKSFKARLYYISTDSKSHGHPNRTLLNGLVRASASQKNKCTILLASGCTLRSSELPTEWNDYVTFKYLRESGHAHINSSDGTVHDAQEYNPVDEDDKSLKCVRDKLNNGSAAQFFKTKIHVERKKYKVTTEINNERFFLSFSPGFTMQKDEAVVCVQLTKVKDDVQITFYTQDCPCLFQCYIERAIEINNADKYYLFRIQDHVKKHLCWYGNKPGWNIWDEKLVFDFEWAAQLNPVDYVDSAPNVSQPFHTSNDPLGTSKTFTVTTFEDVSISEYTRRLGVQYPSGGIMLKTLLSLLMHLETSDQITDVMMRQLPDDNSRFWMDKFFHYTVDEKTIIVLTEEVFSCIILSLPDPPPSQYGHCLKEVQIIYSYSPVVNDKLLSVTLHASWSDEFSIEEEWKLPHNINLTIDLPSESNHLSSYLRDINYPIAVSDCSFSDIILLLLGGMVTGCTAYTALPPCLSVKILNWKVDNIRSTVKVKHMLRDWLVENATIYAQVPATSDSVHNNYLSLGPFQISLQELAATYVAPNTTMTYSGEATILYQSASKQASFNIIQNLSTTAEMQFVVSSTSVSDFLSYLKLNTSLATIHVPIIGTLLDTIVGRTGFILKQSVYDSSDLYLQSLFFEVCQANIQKFLPSAVRPTDITAKVSIFQPMESTHTVGIAASFAADIHSSSEVFKLSCSFSIIPVKATDAPSETGYICTCSMSTSSGNSYTGSASLSSLMAVLGLEDVAQAISSSVPVLKALLDNVTLQEVSLTYNSAAVSHVDEFSITLLVPHWNIISNISIDAFEVNLQFSKESGWSASIQGGLQFGEKYYVSVEFTLPTSMRPGSISFENLDNDFTVNQVVNSLGLLTLSNSEVPILGSILDITIKKAMLGLQTGINGGLSLYGFKVSVYIDSVDMKIFTLSNINATVAYNQSESGFEVSFSVLGFINKKAYLEARYDPSTADLIGRVLVTTDSILSTSECVELFTGQKGLSQNSAYAMVSNDNCVDILLNLKYLSAQKSVFVKQLSITLSIEFAFGTKVVLNKLQLIYTQSLDKADVKDTSSSSILPVGSSLHLLAIMEQKAGSFGLQLSFDCSVKSHDFIATIVPTPGKSLSLRSLLSLFDLANPILPDSDAASKPSTDGFLDLELVKGSLTFKTDPFDIIAFEVTTATSGSGWAILTDPNITLTDIYLFVSYTKECGVSATLCGSLLVGNVKVRLAGTKTDQLSKFSLIVSKSSESIDDLLAAVHSISPASKQATDISSQAGLPKKLQGSMAVFELQISPEIASLNVTINVDLPEWTIDLAFAEFSATDLHLDLTWKQSRSKTNTTLSEYLLKISANLQFGDIPAAVELVLGSQTDTILQASIDPDKIDLGVIADHTLGFLSSDPPDHGKEKRPSFSDLLPCQTVPTKFTTGYLLFNLTSSLCLVYGSVKDLGSCLLVAGKLTEEASTVGYAVTFSLTSLSSLLPPLAAIEDIIAVRNVSASVVNLDGICIQDLIKAVQRAEKYVGKDLPQPPLTNLPLKSGDKIAKKNIVNGMSLYSILDFNTNSILFSNLESIQQTKTLPGDVTLYAHVAKDPTNSVFMACIPSLTLFGLLDFTDIEFQYTPAKESIVTLVGDISIPALAPQCKLHGSLQIKENIADFSLTGSEKPQKLGEPLGMFGVSIINPVLLLHYEFKPFSSHYKLSGSVEFYPSTGSPSKSAKPSTRTVVSLAAECIFVNGTPKVIDIALKQSLTVANLMATIFNTSWDGSFVNIGFFSGRLYYAKLKEDEIVKNSTDGFEYKSGYHMSCRTFLFTEDFQFNIDVSIPLDRTGFSITGSTEHPLDFKLFKVSTAETSDDGDFLEKGPSLSFSYQLKNNQISISLEAGITLLDVAVCKTTIVYFPSVTEFQFTVTYPKDFLGVKNPSINFCWNKEKGFQITSWPLPNPLIPDLFDQKLVNQIKDCLAQKTEKGCSAIVDLAFDKAITSKFDIILSTADKSKWEDDDIYAFMIGGTYDISIAGKLKIVSVDLPRIVVHLPKVKILSMDDVGKYILDTLITNVGSIAKQLVEQPDHLVKLLAAITLKRLGKQALVKTIDSLICRDVDKDDLEKTIEDEANECKDELEENLKEMENLVEDFYSLEVDSLDAAGFFAWAECAVDVVGSALAVVGVVAGGLSLLGALTSIFGKSNDKNKYKNARDEANKKLKDARQKIEKVLKISPPMRMIVCDNLLSISWNSLPALVPNVQYNVQVNVESPLEPSRQFSCTTGKCNWKVTNDCFYTASIVTASIGVSCRITGKKFKNQTITFKGAVLKHSLSHTALLPPPKAVTIGLDTNHAIVGRVQGISDYSKAVKIELVCQDMKKMSHVVSSQLKPGAVVGVNYMFPPEKYMDFSGQAFAVQSQSLREGLQSSTVTRSGIIPQAPPLQGVTHTLPLFGAANSTIDIKWSPPSDKTKIDTIMCQIINTSSGEVTLTKSVGKPLPDMGSFALADLPTEVIPTAQFLCRAGFIPDGSNLANSPFKVDSVSFSLLPPPTKVSVTYLESNLAGSLCVSWLPLSDVHKYQVEFEDVDSKVAALSHEIDITDPDHKSKGACLVNYRLSQSDIAKLQQNHYYSVKIYSLGNNSSSLFSLKPSTFPKSVHYLKEVERFSATYIPDSDCLKITCSQSPGAKYYNKFYLLGRPNFQSTAEELIATTFNIPAHEHIEAKDLELYKPLIDFRNKLSPSYRYSLAVRAFGDTADVASPPKRAASQWSTPEPPTNVTYTYDPTYQEDELKVMCDAVQGFSQYTLALRNVHDQKIVISHTVNDAQKPSASFKGADIGGAEGDKFQCIAKTTGHSGLFNSDWTCSPIIIERLASPTATKVTFGADVTDLTITYPTVPNSQSYLLVRTNTTSSERQAHKFQEKATAGKESLVVTLPTLIEMSHIDEHGLELPEVSITATAIAAENGNFLNSFPGKKYVLNLSQKNRLDSPKNFSYIYDLEKGKVHLKWSPVDGAASYSIQYVQFDSEMNLLTLKYLDELKDIKGVEYVYDIFSHELTQKIGFIYIFYIIAHTSPGATPTLPSQAISLPYDTLWTFDNIVTDLNLRIVNDGCVCLYWKLNKKYQPRGGDKIKIALLASEDGGSTQKVIMSSNLPCTSWNVFNITPKVKYIFKVMSMHLKGDYDDVPCCTIGLPQKGDFMMCS